MTLTEPGKTNAELFVKIINLNNGKIPGESQTKFRSPSEKVDTIKNQ